MQIWLMVNLNHCRLQLAWRGCFFWRQIDVLYIQLLNRSWLAHYLLSVIHKLDIELVNSLHIIFFGCVICVAWVVYHYEDVVEKELEQGCGIVNDAYLTAEEAELQDWWVSCLNYWTDVVAKARISSLICIIFALICCFLKQVFIQHTLMLDRILYKWLQIELSTTFK